MSVVTRFHSRENGTVFTAFVPAAESAVVGSKPNQSYTAEWMRMTFLIDIAFVTARTSPAVGIGNLLVASLAATSVMLVVPSPNALYTSPRSKLRM